MSANGLISRLPDLALTTIRRRRDAKGSPLRPDSLWRVVVSPSTQTGITHPCLGVSGLTYRHKVVNVLGTGASWAPGQPLLGRAARGEEA